METVNILGNVFNSSLSSSLTLNTLYKLFLLIFSRRPPGVSIIRVTLRDETRENKITIIIIIIIVMLIITGPNASTTVC